jgi:NAD(P)-dependent dehydrogenase (short-subunit alcohol dehydrogenase family)
MDGLQPSASLPLRGKVFAITGGASGIGLATAKILSRRGATVCLGDIDAEAMKAADAYFAQQQQQQNAPPHSVTRVDISKSKEVEAWFDGIMSQFGRLDGAANVAGVIGKIHGVCPVSELEDEEWLRIININLSGTMYCMRAELRRVVDGGSIVNVSSIHGLKGKSLSSHSLAVSKPPAPRLGGAIDPSCSAPGFAHHSAYDASKHGVIGLTRAAAMENGDREVRVNAVAPGAIYTPLMQKNWDLTGRPKDAPFDDPTAFKRQGTAEETGNVIAFLLGPESTFVSGSVYSVDGAWL